MENREKSPKLYSRAKRIVFDTMVPFAMALTAMAFGTGLYTQGGFGLISSLIAAVLVFLIMICAQAAFMSSQRAGRAVERVDVLEAAFLGGNEGNSEQVAELTAKVAKFDGVADRVQQIEALAERIDALDGEVAYIRRDRSEVDPSRIQRLAAEVDRIDARQEALRTQLQIESRERYEDLSAELQMLETLVKQMAENIAISKRTAVEDKSEPEPTAIEQRNVPDDTQAVVTEERRMEEPAPQPASAEPPKDEMPGDDVAARPVAEEPEERASAATSSFEPSIDTIPMIDEVRKSIESNRIELYLQPIMMLPQRRVRYYEALTRLRNGNGDLLLPEQYVGLAESVGIMSAIDNVMLFRSVQVLRRLEKRSSARGVFCNISVNSLLDPEFFPEFVAFMEQNQSLSESMYFEFSQAMVEHCGPVEQESLAMLSSLGFRFSLDQVTNLDLDFQSMSERGFRFIKFDADVMLNGMDAANAQIHAVDMRSYLERFGIQMIVSKIENEADVARLLDFNVKLGQGFLFSEPRPVRPEIFGDRKSVAAA